MANTLTNILPKILARGLLNFREQVTMARLVNRDYGAEAKKKGSTIDIPISVANTVTDVTPSPTKPAFVDNAPGLVQITLANWRQAAFHLKDDEMVKIDKSAHFMPMQVHEAIRALAGDINDKIWLEYKGVYNHVGAAGTTPFGTNQQEIVDARKKLHENQVPKPTRRAVWDYDAEAEALMLATFADVEKVGERNVKIEGELGRKYGFDNYTDDAVATHTLAAAGTQDIQAGGHTAGSETIDVDGTTLTIAVVGDIFTIAGDTQQYVVTSAVTNGADDYTYGIAPPLALTNSGTELVTFVATHVVNMAFHREAFAFANRPLLENTAALALGSKIISATDPDTGISLRLEVSRAHKAIVWEFDILYGTGLPRPYAATRVLG